MQKSKVFSKKLVALVLAALMAVSTFFGVASTAYAYENGDYHDSSSNITANALSWVEATDDATLEALLDTVDRLLYDMDWASINKTIGNAGITSAIPGALYSALGMTLSITDLPKVQIETKKIVTVSIVGRVDSIDGVIDILFKLKQALSDISGYAGTIKSLAKYDIEPLLNYLKLDTFGNYFHDSYNASDNAGYRTNGTNNQLQTNGRWRDKNNARYIFRGVLKWVLVDLRPLINAVLNGTVSLVKDGDGKELIDLYKIIGNLIGIDHDSWKYESDSNGAVYNIVKALIVKNVDLYKGEDHLKTEASWNYDTEMFKIANYFLNKWSFEITYPEYAQFTAADKLKYKEDSQGNKTYIAKRDFDSSIRRYLQAKNAGKFDTSTGMIDATYATQNGWDPNLVYSQEKDYEGRILISKYGNETFTLTNQDTIYSLVWRALPIVWKTALKPTIELLRVNYSAFDDEKKGTNFDNAYFYWMNEVYAKDHDFTWVRGENYLNNYNDTYINAWAAAKYADYHFSSAAKFLEHVKHTLTFDQTRVAKNDKYNWRDIDATILFSETRYSPLADHWNIQTGPLNLYFAQTGAPNVIDFFDNLFSTKTSTGFTGSLISQLDNALLAAVKDFFPASSNIGKAKADGEGKYDGFILTNLDVENDLAEDDAETPTVSTLVSTFISDAGIVFKYVADTTDCNILNPFYHHSGNSSATVITETNIEDAIIPFAIAALKTWNLTAPIHNAEWDKVNSVESMAVVALTEYLKYVWPDRDYSDLYTLSNAVTIEGNTYKYVVAKTNESLLNNAIVPMAADALSFVFGAAGVPFFDQTSYEATTYKGAANIQPLTYTFKGKGVGLNNKFWQTMNSLVCYFGETANLSYTGTNNSKSLAALCNAPSAISSSNTVWVNLSNAINTLIPNFYKLANGNTALLTGNAIDAKKLLWDNIVLKAVNIGGTNGLSSILTIVLNIFECPIIKGDGTSNSTTGINNYSVFNVAIFEVVKPLINLLLGSRNGTAADIIEQTKGTTSPVNTFLKNSYLVDTGVPHLLNNILGLLCGMGSTGSTDNNWLTASNNSIHAAAYILMATHLVPKLKDNSIGNGVTAELSAHAVKPNFNDLRLTIKNDSFGINDFYNNSSFNVTRAGRYFARVTAVHFIDISRTSGNDDNKFTVSSADSDKYASPSGGAVTLRPEELIRLNIADNGAPAGTYRVEVVYDIWRYDASDTTATFPTGTADCLETNVKAVEFFTVATNANDYSWKDAFNNGHASNAQEIINAGLVNTATSGYLDLYGPSLIVAGSNAGSSDYGYFVENRDTGATHTANIQYATVAAKTNNYKLKNGTASKDANANAAWVAITKDGYVLDSNGEKTATTAATLKDDENAVGYVTVKDEDDNDVISGVAVKVSAIGNYTPGTPIGGVYLDTESIDIDKRETYVDENNNTQIGNVGANSHRIISGASEGGLDAQYQPMIIKTNVGTFPLTIAAGDIDGNYSRLKETADGLGIHYFTASQGNASVKSKILDAKDTTLAAGVNLDNIADVLDVKNIVNDLIDSAYNAPTDELNAVVNGVIKYRRERSNVDYNYVNNYEEAVKKAQAVENLISVEYQYVKDANGNIINYNENEEAVDINNYEGETHWKKIYEDAANRYHLAKYMSYAPCIVLKEGARVFTDLYDTQFAKRTGNVFNLLYGEVTHATSETDSWDVTKAKATSNFYYERGDFEAEIDENDPDYYRFTYSTKDKEEWDGVHSYTLFFNEDYEFEDDPEENPEQVKFGLVRLNEDVGKYYIANEKEENGEVVQAYTTKSWKAYTDALGEAVAVANYLASEDDKKVSVAYNAYSHLVIAENNLEIYDGEEEPPVSNDITVSGKVVIATQLSGSVGEDGIVGINIYTDVNEDPVGTTAADGTFTVTVPNGTTSLTFSNHQFANGAHTADSTGCTIDRTVTLSGNANVAYEGVIPIIICDWNADGSVSPFDKQTFMRQVGKTSSDPDFNVYCDLNSDGSVSPFDKQVYLRLSGNVGPSYAYPALSLD